MRPSDTIRIVNADADNLDTRLLPAHCLSEVKNNGPVTGWFTSSIINDRNFLYSGNEKLSSRKGLSQATASYSDASRDNDYSLLINMGTSRFYNTYVLVISYVQVQSKAIIGYQGISHRDGNY